MKRQYRLQFDTGLSYGSKEHFFHYMWGYLLPSVWLIHEQQYEYDTTYGFETCGPIMDQITGEMIELLRLDARIIPKEPEGFVQDTFVIPRWDVHLLRDYILDPDKKESHHINNLKQNTELNHHIQIPGFREIFQAKILKTKEIILKQVRVIKTSELDWQNRPILILERSEIHPHYATEGDAEIKGYGMSRRGLQDIGLYVKTQREKGMNILEYEPGKHSLAHQIVTFQNAIGVIGIKGAEFANLIWLKEDAKVIQIRPDMMRTPNVQQKLAELLNLNFREIISKGGNHPSILSLNIDSF